MATETQAAPQLTFVNRLSSIPLINESLSTIHSTLSTNPYTQKPYTTAQAVTQTAYTRIGEPLQVRLAPILVRADGFANKAVDVVESRYPYPFQTPAGDMIKHARERSDQAKDVATKTIDERVRNPVFGVAQGIDQRFAPLVDYFELYVNKLHSVVPETPAVGSTESAQFQYQRAYALTKNLRDSLFVYSNEQMEQIQSQSKLVQRATATAQNISTAASSSYVAAQQKVHGLSDTMLQELKSIQQTTSTLPAHLQHTLHDLTSSLQTTAQQLSAILTQPDVPLSTKVTQIKLTVQEHVHPLLEALGARVEGVLAGVRGKVEGAKESVNGEDSRSYTQVVKDEVPVPGSINGNGHVE